MSNTGNPVELYIYSIPVFITNLFTFLMKKLIEDQDLGADIQVPLPKTLKF